MAFQYYNWEEIVINWEAVDMNWEEVGILEEVLGIVTAAPWAPPDAKKKLKEINKLPEEKKRIVIKIVAKIEGKQFTEYKYNKKGEIKVTAKHINTILEELTKNNIKVHVQNIS